MSVKFAPCTYFLMSWNVFAKRNDTKSFSKHFLLYNLTFEDTNFSRKLESAFPWQIPSD